MRETLLIMGLDLKGSVRSKWFIAYSLVFILMAALVFSSGVAESRVMGFTGLTRGLLVFIQACNIVMPVFILVTTVRTISGDRESNVLEYLLSFPVSLRSYYWGKFLGRFAAVFLPLAFSLVIATLAAFFFGGGFQLVLILLYTGLLCFNAFAFLGIAFFISSVCRNQGVALGVSLFVWLMLIAFLDIALISFMIKNMFPETLIFSAALLNPVQVFRISAISLFDPVLSVIGPASYFILDTLGRVGLILYSLIYPIIIGACFAVGGYAVFKNKDIV